jgi:hypothetical protein
MFSHHQKIALDLCIEKYGICPYGCAKDGAPNCAANVAGYNGRQCEPGKRTQQAARAHREALNEMERQSEQMALWGDTGPCIAAK